MGDFVKVLRGRAVTRRRLGNGGGQDAAKGSPVGAVAQSDPFPGIRLSRWPADAGSAEKPTYNQGYSW